MRVCTCVMDPARKVSPSGPFPVDPLARSWMVGIGPPAGETQKEFRTWALGSAQHVQFNHIILMKILKYALAATRHEMFLRRVETTSRM